MIVCLNATTFTSDHLWHSTKNVRVTITILCLFFNVICSKVIDPRNLDEFEHEVAIILCQLDMFFPHHSLTL